jgi:succinoglycan biosynthesis transport protein ExoP
MKSSVISLSLSNAITRLREFPVSTALNTSTKDGFVVVSDPNSIAAQRYSDIVDSILAGPWPKQRMLITSPAPGDGKTLTAVNMALALAAKGRSVFLVELTLTRPRYRYVFRADSSHRGVESVLKGEADPADVTFQLGDTRVGVASVANAMPNDDLLMRSDNLQKLLDYGESSLDWTILEAPSINESRVVKRLATAMGPVVMVARSHQTKVEAFRRATATLGNDLDYVILNDVAS